MAEEQPEFPKVVLNPTLLSIISHQPGMSRPVARSSGGCWTCRIRHRKCDESSPTCNECTDRHIKCHGYGPEPEWIRDPSKLRAELQHIKLAVKQNFRQVRKLQASRSPRRALGTPRSTIHTSPTPPAGDSEFREAELLMYYLDYIFPLQYQYYVDKPAAGGRGWLFWLLSRRGPLRHAAFTLSALHQHSTCQNKTEDMESELIRYHTNAMQELRQVLSHCETAGFANHAEHRVEFLTCGTFLISFEIFQGGTSNWEPHLNALISVASQIDTRDLEIESFQPPTPHSGLQRMVDAAIKFHMAQLVGFDLISCIATGNPPKLPYRTWLSLPGVDVASILGCRNWAMLALGDIALLETELANVDPDTLAERISDISGRLNSGIESLSTHTEESRGALVHGSVTRVYATATLVQLCALTANDETLHEKVENAVSRVIDALQQMPTGRAMRGLVWPMCVAGAMATQAQQTYFERPLEGILGESGTAFTSCGTGLEILRESWAYQDTSEVDRYAARSAMRRLGISALLV